ncbi:MAG TPA: hypothetical protein VER55_15160 [Ardenticatenaceae bacterium]|nr:hypothetical protein [Ardenticatenaceae bacterium]
MPGLPAGTVTFLFTDIEGSTRLLLQRLGDAYAEVLQHYELLRAAFRAHYGHEVGTEEGVKCRCRLIGREQGMGVSSDFRRRAVDAPARPRVHQRG